MDETRKGPISFFGSTGSKDRTERMITSLDGLAQGRRCTAKEGVNLFLLTVFMSTFASVRRFIEVISVLYEDERAGKPRGQQMGHTGGLLLVVGEFLVFPLLLLRVPFGLLDLGGDLFRIGGVVDGLGGRWVRGGPRFLLRRLLRHCGRRQTRSALV